MYYFIFSVIFIVPSEENVTFLLLVEYGHCFHKYSIERCESFRGDVPYFSGMRFLEILEEIIQKLKYSSIKYISGKIIFLS